MTTDLTSAQIAALRKIAAGEKPNAKAAESLGERGLVAWRTQMNPARGRPDHRFYRLTLAGKTLLRALTEEAA